MVEKQKVGDTHLCGGYVPPLFLQWISPPNSNNLHKKVNNTNKITKCTLCLHTLITFLLSARTYSHDLLMSDAWELTKHPIVKRYCSKPIVSATLTWSSSLRNKKICHKTNIRLKKRKEEDSEEEKKGNFLSRGKPMWRGGARLVQLPEGVVLVIVQDTSHAQKASVFSSLLKSLEHSC